MKRDEPLDERSPVRIGAIGLLVAASYKGKVYNLVLVTSTNGNAVTIDPNASETICGKTTVKMTGTYDRMQIQSDGSNWHGIGEGSCFRTLSANLVCSSGSSISSNNGHWINSYGNVASGNCDATFNSGVFSAAPVCSSTVLGCNASTGVSCGNMFSTTNPSTTGIGIRSVSDTGTNTTVHTSNLVCY